MPRESNEFMCRGARLDDEPFLWTVLYHALYVPPGRPAYPVDAVRRPELARYVTGWCPQTEPGVVAETGTGRRIGAAWVRCLRGENAGYGHVADDVPELSIAVLPDCRGRGAGGAMLERLLQLIEPRFRGVSLSVSRENPAYRLYLRHGFREYAAAEETVIMLREFVLAENGKRGDNRD